MGGNDRDLQNQRWRETRKLVLQRDRYTCYVCGARANTVDHIVPRSMGGTHELSNLAACCAKHNIAKHDRAPAVPLPSRMW